MQLECVECDAAVARFARGWRAYLTCEPSDEDEAVEPVQVVVVCPDCSERESARRSINRGDLRGPAGARERVVAEA